MLPNIEIYSISNDRINLIRELWEGLRDHHAANSKYFKARYHTMSFEQRKKTLLEKAKNGKLKIDIAGLKETKQIIAYCISSVTEEISGTAGEIDSIFISESYRKKGIGSALMDRAINWLNEEKTDINRIMVAQGNEDALEFYSKYDFYPLHIILQQKK